jgi:hypothetical protein
MTIGKTFDTPESCPECGSADAEYLPHEAGCPSGYPTRDATDELQEAAREYEDEHPMSVPRQA